MTARRSTLVALAGVAALALAVVAPGGLSGSSRPPFPAVLTPTRQAELRSLSGVALPDEGFLFQRTGTGPAPSLAQLRRAGAQATVVARATAKSQPALASRRWKPLGPSNIGARVVDIAVDPRLLNTLYLASASGGVWRSRDAGSTFQSVWGLDLPQAMGALAMGTDGALWAGTGEANPGGGSLTYGGGGVYRSTDRGRTWKNVGLGKTSRIGRIAVDPKDPRHVFVAATGNLFAPGGDRGLYETRDAGRTWRLALQGDTATTGAVDVAIDPKDPHTVFATMWDAIRYPDRRVYTGLGSGLYRSTDGGATFARLGLLNGLPPALPSVGRIGVGIDPQNPMRVYAIYANNDLGAYEAWFVSSDGGDTWTSPVTAAPFLADSQYVYGWWFGRVWVDPANSNHVFVAGLTLAESTDGGSSFSEQSQPHADQHAMAWDPHVPHRVYLGDDGGLYRSDQDGLSGSWIHGRVQPWSQFFQIDVSPQDPRRINGGLQDNGSVRSWGDSDWNAYNGGDGVENVINPTNKDNVFACSQYGACNVSTNGGSSSSAMAKTGTRDGWLTPIEFQPGSGNVVYWGGDTLNRSTDAGQNFSAVSPDLGKMDPGTEINPLYAAHYGTVQAIGLTAANPDTIYAGTDNAHLWRTTDGGTSWTELTSSSLPKAWVTSIAVDPAHADHLYVSYSGFRQNDAGAYVLYSKDGGATWTNVSANLPRAPVSCLVLAGGRLYAATDVGVYVTKAAPVRWYRLGAGLPRSPVNNLRFIATNGTLYAATFGHGIYSIVPPKF